MNENGDDGLERARRRLRGFGFHMAGYFLTMVILVPINLTLTPENHWFVLPMIGWGSVLAIHAAYAMGLFGGGAKRE